MSGTKTAGIVLLCGLVATGAGCGTSPREPAIQGHPAKGEVVFKGSQPLTGGLIEFLPVGAAGQRAFGTIEPDGKFQLSTFQGNDKVPGAVEGEYQVSVTLPPGMEHAPPPPINLPGTYQVKPQNNEFHIEVPKPNR
jgi:hypothetical protein